MGVGLLCPTMGSCDPLRTFQVVLGVRTYTRWDECSSEPARRNRHGLRL